MFLLIFFLLAYFVSLPHISTINPNIETQISPQKSNLENFKTNFKLSYRKEAYPFTTTSSHRWRCWHGQGPCGNRWHWRQLRCNKGSSQYWWLCNNANEWDVYWVKGTMVELKLKWINLVNHHVDLLFPTAISIVPVSH